MNIISWKVQLYSTTTGDKPLKDFIDSLELKAQSKIYNTIELLKQFGIQLGAPHTKKLTGTDLWELRILGADSLRVFYIAIQGQTFLLLHGFKKKSQKTPQSELKLALKRLEEYQTRK